MTEDRALRIEVGYELESRVTDLVASSVIRHTMIPRIERGEWDAAIEQGVEALSAAFAAGRYTEGLRAAIETIGERLARDFPADPGQNPDEPPNTLA